MADTRELLDVGVRAPIDVAALGAWVRAHVHPFDGALSARQFSHGQSNPTYVLTFAAGGREPLVLRKQPDGPILPSAHAVDREYRVLCALHERSNVPVPRPVALCLDPSVVGTPFYLMAFVEGRVFLQPHLPSLQPAERYAVYHAMCEVLARIHAVDWVAAGLADFARPGGYAARQVKRWRAQSALAQAPLDDAGEASPPALGELGEWLAARAAEMDGAAGPLALVHGDFRLDNLVFTHAPQLRVAAVLDWELATVGDARADVGYVLGAYAALAEELGGARGEEAGYARLSTLGIPSDAQFAAGYARSAVTAPLRGDDAAFFSALAAFRLAAIQQGVLARALAGNASSARAREAGALFRQSAARGLRLARRDVWARSASARVHPLELLPCAFSPRVRALYDRLEAFIEARVLPAEAEAAAELERNVRAGVRWRPLDVLGRLQAEARAAGLWNAWLSPELGALAARCCDGVAPGLGLSTVEYAPLAELTGRSGLLAPEALNCSAPDTGNMELLARFGSAEQQARWLRPLLDGQIRSCYAMTEPDVASSDASALELEVTRAPGPRGEDGYVLRGSKWWVSGAGDPRCRLVLVLGRMGGARASAGHGAHSVLLVPVDAAGLRVVRPLRVFGYDDAPHGHCELSFENVWVSKRDGLLLGEGRGFEMAQARLGPGRVHHCMRALGLAERCLEAACRRAKSRVAFGELLAHKVRRERASCAAAARAAHARSRAPRAAPRRRAVVGARRHRAEPRRARQRTPPHAERGALHGSLRQSHGRAADRADQACRPRGRVRDH